MNDLLLKESHAGGQLLVNGQDAALNFSPSVGQLVAQRPEYARVFEKYKIEYCCGGGNNSVAQACSCAGADLNRVQQDLATVDAASVPPTSLACTRPPGTIQEGVDHLLSVHHDFLRQEMPRITRLINRIVDRHGELHPRFWDLRDLIEEFVCTMGRHLDNQANVLFPLLKRIETPFAWYHLDNIFRDPIATLRSTHNRYRILLAGLNQWTNGYTTPPGACTTYRVLMEGLSDLDAEVERYFTEELTVFDLALNRDPKPKPRPIESVTK